jgi:hypothetical protein
LLDIETDRVENQFVESVTAADLAFHS